MTGKIHFLNALGAVQVPPPLLKGVQVIQVSANGKARPATLELSEDKFTLTIASSERQSSGIFFRSNSGGSSENRAIDIGEMDRIQRGQSTEQFEKAKLNAVDLSRTRRPDLLRNASTGSGSTMSTTTTLSIQQLDPRRSFSIIFRGAETLDLMAASLDDREMICSVLDKILETYQRAKTRVADDVRLLRYVWLDVDKNKARYVNVHQISQVFAQINLMMKSRDVQANYEKFGKVIGLDRSMRRRGLNFEQFAAFLHYIRRNSWVVKPVTIIWNELFGEIMNNGKIRETVSEKTFLEKFLQKTQGEANATILDVRKLFRRLHNMEISHQSASASAAASDMSRITKDQFEAFLLSSGNEAFDPEKERFDEADMNQPLAEYFINSSHNTYLIGDQYTSASRVEMYSNALYRGCRCLELDIWDGGKAPKTGEPIPVVWHGHTMTSKINFVDIIRTIKVFLNFHPDTFPLILSFENHCSIPFQEYMAEQLEKILGDALYVPTEASLHGPLPSPAQLRGMVLLKGRRPDGTEAEAYDSEDDSDDDGVTSSMGELTVAQQANREKVKKHGVAPSLAKLTLFHGFKFKNFEASMRTPTHHMHSFSENKIRSRCRQKGADSLTLYNQTHMSRTYPAGSRLDSSNYNPLLAWSTGCQMVALNFQTQDAFLRLNDGRFRENGNCGYVLKPSALMVRDNGAMKSSRPMKLSIRVLSGSCLPKPKGLRQGDCIDPYVKVAVFDVYNREKEAVTEQVTSVVRMNGFFPIWAGQEKFSFSIWNWSVAMLQLTIYDKNKEEFIACSSIPVSCLRQGIRCVRFYDNTNTRSGAFDFASLLVEIKTSKIVAEI